MQNRRDLARLETRSALALAAFELLREEGPDGLTADSIAQRAGVSRRTFFNYFPTTDAVLAVPSIDFLEAALAEVRARPAHESLMESVVAALTAADPEVLSRFASVVRLCEGKPSAERVEREVWNQAETDVAEALRARLGPDAEPLRVDVLAGAVMSAGRTGVKAWIATLQDPATQADPADLRRHLIQAFGYLTDGFQSAPARP